MKTGHHSRLTTGIIDYKQLRKVNPETARLAVLEYLKTNHHNVSDAARVFSINRCVVYDIIHKEREGDLKDRPRTPKRQPSKTPSQIEDKVIEVKNQTGYGPKRLSRHLEKHHQLKVPYGTIRTIKAIRKKTPIWREAIGLMMRSSTFPGF